MSSGQSSPDFSSRSLEERREERSAESRTGSKNESQQLLDEVLEATLELSKSDEPLGPDELKKLVAVARRRKSEPFTVETVAELVQTVLRARFRRVIESSSLWDRTTHQIAATIFEDPRAKERMRAFWQRLCEVAS
jgi:hypothetical protein